MTPLKIAKKEKDILSRVCADAGIDVTFYTMEENELMTFAEIDTNSGSVMFYLGRSVAVALELAELKGTKP